MRTAPLKIIEWEAKNVPIPHVEYCHPPNPINPDLQSDFVTLCTFESSFRAISRLHFMAVITGEAEFTQQLWQTSANLRSGYRWDG